MKKLVNEPLELFVYSDGIAVLWREGATFRVYHSGEVITETPNESDAFDSFDVLCSKLETQILSSMPRLQ